MAEIKWIKIVTDLFDDAKMLLIDEEKDRDKIIVIWIKLLCLAGKQNNGGIFRINEKTPYTMEMFSRYFQRPKKDIAHAFNIFTKLGMIEYEKGAVKITNWERHQTFDSSEKQREQARVRMQKMRERERNCYANTSVTNGEQFSVTKNALNTLQSVTERDKCVTVTQTEEEREIEKEKEKEKEKDTASSSSSPLSPPLPIPPAAAEETAERIARIFRENAPSFHSVAKLTPTRRAVIEERAREYGRDFETFETVFKKAEASDFLKGSNPRGWRADFDWIIKRENFVKILEGKYDNRTTASENSSFDTDEFFEAALKRSYENIGKKRTNADDLVRELKEKYTEGKDEE